LHRELGPQGFALLTVTGDPAADVLRMVEYNGITHPIVSDTKDAATGKVFEKYHAYDGKHYLIRGDGTIIATFSKLGVSLPVLRRELAKHGIRSAGSAPAASAAAGATRAATADTATRGPVRWKASAPPATVARGATITVTLSAIIAPGWHVYATTQREGGPVPLAIGLGEGQGFRLAGPIRSPAPESKFDPNFGIDVALHVDRADFAVPIAVAGTARLGRQTLVLDARYQACNASICLPPQSDRIEVTITVSGTMPAATTRPASVR